MPNRLIDIEAGRAAAGPPEAPPVDRPGARADRTLRSIMTWDVEDLCQVIERWTRESESSEGDPS